MRYTALLPSVLALISVLLAGNMGCNSVNWPSRVADSSVVADEKPAELFEELASGDGVASSNIEWMPEKPGSEFSALPSARPQESYNPDRPYQDVEGDLPNEFLGQNEKNIPIRDAFKNGLGKAFIVTVHGGRDLTMSGRIL